jgi:glycosyltransferase involved in cell wall biosynthesis
MKIAIDARSLEGNRTGVGRYLENMLRVWRGRRDIEFYLYFKDTIQEDEFLQSDNFVLRKLDNPLGFSSNFFFQHILLPYNLFREKADFFFSPFYLRPFFCPVKSSIALHDISYEAHPEWFDRREQFVLRLLSRLSAKRADLIFTISDHSRREIMSHYGVADSKIIVTPLAPSAGFRRVEDASKIAAVKNKYGLSRFVLNVGSIFTRRHAPEMIEAFARFSEKNKDHQLCIVGKNRTFPHIDIDARINEINARAGRVAIVRIDFVDEDELMALYSGAEAVIYLSDYEGFGLPVVEGQFFGKPVITSYNTSLVEVGGDSVEFVAENRTEDILVAFDHVLEDESYRRHLQEKGEMNLMQFDWTKCAQDTIAGIIKINT